MMKNIFLLFLCVIIVASCNSEPVKISPFNIVDGKLQPDTVFNPVSNDTIIRIPAIGGRMAKNTPAAAHQKTMPDTTWTTVVKKYVPPAVTPNSGYNPPFPRLAAYTLSNPKDYGSEGFLDIAIRYHVLILGTWPGYKHSKTNRDLSAITDYIHANSKTGTKVLQYIVSNEASPTARENLAYAGFINYLTETKSWLYRSGTAGDPVASTWPHKSLVNITNYAPVVNGKRWNQWYPHAAWDVFMNGNGTAYGLASQKSVKLDGFFMDNVFSRPRVKGDWNRDGETDDIATAAPWIREGEIICIQQLREDCPSCYVTGNTVDFKNLSLEKGVLDQALDGGVLEGQFGEPWSPRGTAAMMASYKNQMDMYRGDKLGIFCAYVPQGDYVRMRYVLTACLMGNGYLYIYNAPLKYDQTLRWMDEFNFNLGKALQHPVYTSENGIYKREFENGIAIMNAIGNGTKTIDLGKRYYKLPGMQSSYLSSNGDAAGITSITLEDGDGIILSVKPTN